MRQIKTLLTAAALLILAACGSNNTFPKPTITSVTPTEVTFGTELTITGSNYYAVTGAANTRVEVCGVTLSGSIVEPLTRSILLPPGSTITAEVGTTITGSLPEEGITEGRSDVLVTRPDGSTAVLENAVTCVIPTEEPEPEPEPVVAVISASASEGTVPLTVTFDARATTGEGELEYYWDFGVGGATATGIEHDYEYLQAGTYIVTLTVTDEHGQTDSATHTVVVIEPEPSTPAPQITSFDAPESVVAGDTVKFTWVISYEGSGDLICEINPGDGAGYREIADCGINEFDYEYDEPGSYEAALRVTDEYNPAVITMTDVIALPAPPDFVNFAGTPNPADIGEEITFGFDSYTYHSLDVELNCSIDPGDGSTPSDSVTCSPFEHTHTYASAGTFTATLVVRDELGRDTEFTTSVEVLELSRPELEVNVTGLPDGEYSQVAITGPNGYAETIMSGSTITLPEAGEYSISPEAQVQANVRVPYGAPGNFASYLGAWEPTTVAVDFTATAGEKEIITFHYEPVTTNLTFNLSGLPDGYDISHPDLVVWVQRLNEPEGDTWGPHVRVTESPYETTPGIYDVTYEVLNRDVEPAQGTTFHERYSAPPELITADWSGANIETEYAIVTASLTVNALGLPGDLIPTFDLENRTTSPFESVTGADWDVLAPGSYYLRPQAVLGGSIPLPEGLDPDDVNYASVDGLIDVVYTADPTQVRLNSGATEVIDRNYSIKDGLLRVHIQRPYGAEYPVEGNVSVRRYPDGEWTTYTTEELHLIYTEPGVYEARIENVDPEPGVHDGYYASNYATKMLYAVPTYHYIPDVGVRHITIDVRYTANSP